MQILTNDIVNDGLVLYLDAGIKGSYPGSGTTWTDLAGSNNGTITGVTYSSANGGLLEFSGADQYVDCGDTLDDVFAGAGKQFTISAWAKFDNLASPRTIISKFGETGFHGEDTRQWSCRVYDISGTKRFEFFTFYELGLPDYVGWHVNDTAISTSIWYFFTASYDGASTGSNRFNLYINGTLRSKQQSFSVGSEGSIQDGPARLAIGALLGSVSANNPSIELDGQVAMTMIHNRVLSAAEVAQNFEATRNRFGI